MNMDKRKPLLGSFDEGINSDLVGVNYTVLLPRERTESVEILLQRTPVGRSIPVHQHKECEQTYLVLEGEAEVQVGDLAGTVRKGSVVYIPRLTDHSVRNTGDRELVYIVVENYPDGYLPDEPHWDDHLQDLIRHYGEN